MNVEVLSWGPSEALALVDGTRVRVRRYKAAVVWICAEHGTSRNAPGCPHTAALADTPADPDTFTPGPTVGDKRPPRNTTNPRRTPVRRTTQTEETK